MRKALIGLLLAGVMSIGLAAPASAKGDLDGPVWDVKKVCVQSKVGARWGVKKVVANWNALKGGPTLKVRKKCHGKAGTIRVRTRSNFTVYTGVTNWAYDSADEITDAQVYLNPRRIRRGFASANRRCMMRHTTAHELGHALGLPHYLTTHSGSVMSYLGWKKRCGNLSRHDKHDYAALYTD